MGISAEAMQPDDGRVWPRAGFDVNGVEQDPPSLLWRAPSWLRRGATVDRVC
jgi:hypothetical protein